MKPVTKILIAVTTIALAACASNRGGPVAELTSPNGKTTHVVHELAAGVDESGGSRPTALVAVNNAGELTVIASGNGPNGWQQAGVALAYSVPGAVSNVVSAGIIRNGAVKAAKIAGDASVKAAAALRPDETNVTATAAGATANSDAHGGSSTASSEGGTATSTSAGATAMSISESEGGRGGNAVADVFNGGDEVVVEGDRHFVEVEIEGDEGDWNFTDVNVRPEVKTEVFVDAETRFNIDDSFVAIDELEIDDIDGGVTIIENTNIFNPNSEKG